MLLLLAAPRIHWLRETLGKHAWLVIVLIALAASHFIVGGILYRSARKTIEFVHSPEGRRQRTEQVQATIAAIIAEAEARPKLDLHQMVLDKTAAASVMTEARRLAKKAAEDELRRRFARFPSDVGVKELSRIANALLTTDPNVIEMAKANVAKRASASPLTSDRVRFGPLRQHGPKPNVRDEPIRSISRSGDDTMPRPSRKGRCRLKAPAATTKEGRFISQPLAASGRARYLFLSQTECEEGGSQHTPSLSITWAESLNSVMRPERRSKNM
jgi:hypothetical protein